MKCDVVMLTKAANNLVYRAVSKLALYSRDSIAKCARGRADFSVKRNAEEFFREHDKNDIDNTVAKDFYLSK